MLRQVHRWLPTRDLIVVADSSFAALELLGALIDIPTPVHMVTRLRLDAQLYCPAPPQSPGTMGHPRKVGQRLPGLKALINNPYPPWQTVVMEDWYGKDDYPLEIASSTAVWYHSGLPAVTIRWVLIKDPKERFETQALYCFIWFHYVENADIQDIAAQKG